MKRRILLGVAVSSEKYDPVNGKFFCWDSGGTRSTNGRLIAGRRYKLYAEEVKGVG